MSVQNMQRDECNKVVTYIVVMSEGAGSSIRRTLCIQQRCRLGKSYSDTDAHDSAQIYLYVRKRTYTYTSEVCEKTTVSKAKFEDEQVSECTESNATILDT